MSEFLSVLKFVNAVVVVCGGGDGVGVCGGGLEVADGEMVTW
jgi:hypothetical protein